MRQDIILVVPRTMSNDAIREKLACTGLNVTLSECIEGTRAGLILHSPAFLLLDMQITGAEAFLREVSRSVLHPPPYILAANTYSSAAECMAVLELGADACVTKPIAAKDILVIINTVLRREQKIARLHSGKLMSCIKHKDLVIDPLRRTVKLCGESIDLTAREFDILYLLAYHEGNVLTKEEIYEAVWKTQCNLSAANVSGHIFSLRKKMGLDSKNRDYIQTVYGVGYRFAKADEP